MRPLSPAELMEVWERGAAETPAKRTLLLLAAALPDTPSEQLADLSIGERDAQILELHQRAYGGELPCLTDCPACRQTLEWDLNADDLRLRPEQNGHRIHSLTAGGVEVEFRLPTAGDLAWLSPRLDAPTNRQRLFNACVVKSRRDGLELPPDQLPGETTTAVVARMAELDPMASLQFELRCPQCDHAWAAGFDIVSFFWAELEAWSARLLREVHDLASAYGWSEGAILALSPQRRQAYLELIRA